MVAPVVLLVWDGEVNFQISRCLARGFGDGKGLLSSHYQFARRSRNGTVPTRIFNRNNQPEVLTIIKNSILTFSTILFTF